MPVVERNLTLAGALPEFTTLSENEVWRAIATDNETESAILVELRRLVAVFLREVGAYIDSLEGKHGRETVVVEVVYPIERIALQMILGYVELRTGSCWRIK